MTDHTEHKSLIWIEATHIDDTVNSQISTDIVCPQCLMKMVIDYSQVIAHTAEMMFGVKPIPLEERKKA